MNNAQYIEGLAVCENSCVWKANGLTSQKQNYPEFLTYISGYDIILVYESSKAHLQLFRCFNQTIVSY